MTDDDRTEMIGAVAPGPTGKHRTGAPDERLDEPFVERRGRVAEPPPSRRRPFLVAVAAIVGVLLVGLVGLFLYELNGGGTPSRVAVPSVAGQSSDMAQNTISSAGLRPRIANVASADVARDGVVRTDPVSGTSVDASSVVTLYISTGPMQVQVPTVVNLTQAQAQAALTAAGLSGTAAATPVASDSVAAGSVISSDPAAGASVDASSVVTLTISSGPEQVSVPSVINLSQDDATANLQEAGFMVNPVPTDSTSTAGRVVDQNPAGRAQAAKGATITISVSRGNRITMPNLVGQNRTTVAAVLATAGYTGGQGNLTAVPTTVTDSTQVGTVLTQDPAANAVIEPSQAITYTYGVAATTTVPPTTTTTVTAPPGG